MSDVASLRLRKIEPNIAMLRGLQIKINALRPLFIPIKERNYFQFELHADGVVCQSMLDVVAWLENKLVTPDTLAWRDIDPFYLGYVFALKVPKLSISALAPPGYEVKEVRVVAGTEIAGEKIKIPSTAGELLFDAIPSSMLPPVVFAPPWALKVPLTFSLGSSRIKSVRLMSVSYGDLLLIQRIKHRVYIADRLAFSFNLSDEGSIMVDEYDEEDTETEEEINEDIENESEESSDESGAVINDENIPRSITSPDKFELNKINLKMNFLLQQQTMTLDEVSQLQAGSLIKLLPDAEKKIIMMVNNQRYAKGELIQIGDNLAVEVQEVYFGEDKGK